MNDPEKITKFSETLREFLPVGTEYIVAKFLIEHQCDFTISKARKTKLGDYRQPWNGKPHRISVNGNLNCYAFLVTTIHEMAHLITFNDHGNAVKAHGKEWKEAFTRLFVPVLEKEILPLDITLALTNYLKNARAASCTDERLYRVLRRYDKNKQVLVEHLNQGAIFELGGKTFVLGRRLRKRFECKELNSDKTYRVLGLAEVDKLVEEK